MRYVYSFFLFLLIVQFSQGQAVLLVEDFEGGKPDSWSQFKVKGDDVDGNIVEWKFDVEEGVNSQPGPDPLRGKITRFDYQSPNGTATQLITPRLALKNRVKPELRFYHAQRGWNKGGDEDDIDELIIYMKKGEETPWVQLAEFIGEVPVWTWQTINLPDSLLSDSVYIAFEGISRYGNGVCVDSVVILETDVMDRYVSNIEVSHPSLDIVPGGTLNNPMLQIAVQVSGNSGMARLDSLVVSSLNDYDNVLDTDGVKLYYTTASDFSADEQLGVGVNFENEIASFSQLNKELQTGMNYLWITYDVLDSNLFQGAKLDLRIDSLALLVSDSLLPANSFSPAGYRTFFQALFFDDFETIKGWTFPHVKDSLGLDLPNEFEIDTTCGASCEELLGGTKGNANPQFPYSGRYLLGSDVTGQGAFPGDYESSLLPYQYSAVSPTVDCFYYNQLQLIFKRWLNVYLLDYVGIEVSDDDGVTWHPVWLNVPSSVSDNQWNTRTYDLGHVANRKNKVKIRFFVGPTQGFNNNYSGWNIDDLIITGNYVQQDVGIASWVSPVEGCGHSSSDSVRVWVKNFGAEDVLSDIPLKYSFSGALNVDVYDTLYGGIPYQDSVLFTFREPVDLSVPYFYDSVDVYVQTLLSQDEDAGNDRLHTLLRVIPTHKPPYVEDFEEGFGFWTVLGDERVWEYGNPGGVIIDGAASGNYAWVTSLYGYYSPGDSLYVESPCYDLQGVDYPVLQMNISSRLYAGFDGVALHYSLDDGASWDPVPTHSYPYDWNWYNADSIAGLGGPGWDTTYNEWITARQFLPAHTANQSRIKFRIGLESAGDDFREGFGFDDFTLYDAPNDLGVTHLVYPFDTCDLSPSEDVVVAIRNYGIDTLAIGDSFMVEVVVNEEQVRRDTVFMEKQVSVGDTFHYRMSGSFDMYLAGNYYVNAYTISFLEDNIYADTLYNNDSIMDSVLVYKPYVFFGSDIYTVQPDTLVLNAFSDPGNLYSWQDEPQSSDSVFHVQEAGTYYVEVLNLGTLCKARDTIKIHRLIADVGIPDWDTISSDCVIGDSIPVTVVLYNYGNDTIRYGHAMDFSYEVEDVAAVRETWVVPDSVKVYPDSSYSYTFGQSLDMSSVGLYDFQFYVDFSLDDSSSNDTLGRSAQVYGYPDFDLMPSDTIHRGFSLRLDAKQGNPEWVDFAWHDGSTDSVFIVTEQGTGMYHATVTDVYGCSSSDSSRVRLLIVDVEMNKLLEPLTSCGGLNDKPVMTRIINVGTDTLLPGTKVPLAYAFDSMSWQWDTLSLSSRFEPGDSLVFEFSQTLSYDSTGAYEMLVYASLHNDSVPENDSLVQDVLLHALPSVDLGEDRSVLNEPSYTLDPGSFETYTWMNGSTVRYDSVFVVDYQNWFDRVFLLVSDSNGCDVSDNVKIDLDFLNLSLDTVMFPDTLCDLLNQATVSVRVANKGTQVVPGYTLESSFVPGDTTETPISAALGLMGTKLHTIYVNGSLANQGDYAWYVNLEINESFYQDIVSEDDSLVRPFYLYGLPDVQWNGVDEDTIALDAAYPFTLELNRGYDAYDWENGDSYDPSYQVESDGWYQVEVVDERGCVNIDSVYVLGHIGIEHYLYGAVAVHLYPVPVKDRLYMDFSVEGQQYLSFSVLDMQGRVMFFDEALLVGQQSQSINVSDWPSGLYLLTIEGKEMLHRSRFVVE